MLESLFHKHRCFPVNIAKFLKSNFFFQFERKFLKKVIISNYRQQYSEFSSVLALRQPEKKSIRVSLFLR